MTPETPHRVHVAGNHASLRCACPTNGRCEHFYVHVLEPIRYSDPYTRVADPILYRKHTDVDSELQIFIPGPLADSQRARLLPGAQLATQWRLADVLTKQPVVLHGARGRK